MNILLSVESWILGWFNLIPKLIYFLLVTMMSVLDIFQLLLRKMAGLDSWSIGTGGAQTGDIALAFLKSIFETDSQFPALKNAFWALIVLGVILLLVTTIIASIRQEYMPASAESKAKDKNNRIYVLKRAFKSLALFLIVPVSVIFGLLFSDIFLMAIDQATTSQEVVSPIFKSAETASKLKSVTTTNGTVTYSFYDIFGGSLPSTTTSFSGYMFKTAGYSANRVRKTNTYNDKTYYQLIADGDLSNFEIFNTALNEDDMAAMIDDAFANNIHLSDSVNKSITLGPVESLTNAPIWGVNEGYTVNNFSKFNVGLVWYFYDLWFFNYIIGFLFLIVSLKILFNATLGLARRIIEMVALFIISPPVIAIMPLDEGKAFFNWRKNFVTKALSAYGVIIGMNVLFLILPYLQEIKLFSPTSYAFKYLNLIFSTLFIVLGLLIIESFLGLISKMIGGEDANKSGGTVGSEMGNALRKSALLVGGATGFAFNTAKTIGKGALGATKMLDSAFTGGKLTNASRYLKYNLSQAGQSVKNFGEKATNSLTGLTFSKDINQVKTQASNEWEKGKADELYTSSMQKDEQYQKELEQAYDEFLDNGGNASKENFLSRSKSGSFAKSKAEANYARRINQTRLEHKNDMDAMQKYVASKVADFKQNELKDRVSQRRQHVANAVIKNTGLGNLSTLGEIYTSDVKSGIISGGKGGIPAMINAFKGKSTYDMEIANIKKKIQKEESMRARRQVEYQKQLEDKKKK